MREKIPYLVSAVSLAAILGISSICFARDTTQLPEIWTTVQIPEKAAYIFVHESGHVRVSNGEEMSLPLSSLEELDTFLTTLRSTRVDLPIVVKIDRRTKYKHVEPVFAALAEHGFPKIYLLVIQKTIPMDPELKRFFQEIAGK